MVLRKVYILALFSFICLDINAQAYKINFEISDYDNDTLLVGYYYGDRQLLLDTVYAKKKGVFELSGAESLKDGMYLALLRPANNFIQFLIDGKAQNFDIKFSSKDMTKVKFTNSPINKEFMDYVGELKDMREKADPIREKLKKEKDEGKPLDIKSKETLDKLDKEVDDIQHAVVAKNPNSLFANLLKSNWEVDIPEFEGTKEEVDLRKFYFFRNHYFDYIDFKLPGLIRTPYVDQRIQYYIDKLTPQNPDSLILSLDFILDKLKPNEEAWKFYVSHFLNVYAKNKYIGMDGIYVHLADKYYTKELTPWVDEDNLGKIKKNADELRPILIGKKMPNLTTYKEDGTPVTLYDIKAKYVVVVFWAPDCGHCKKSMPFIVDYHKKVKDKGVVVYSVCTKGGDKMKTCWEGITEKNMEEFINTADEFQRYRKSINIPTTPKVFILDENKKILIKDFTVEEIEKVMDEVIKFNEKEKDKPMDKQ